MVTYFLPRPLINQIVRTIRIPAESVTLLQCHCGVCPETGGRVMSGPEIVSASVGDPIQQVHHNCSGDLPQPLPWLL